MDTIVEILRFVKLVSPIPEVRPNTIPLWYVGAFLSVNWFLGIYFFYWLTKDDIDTRYRRGKLKEVTEKYEFERMVEGSSFMTVKPPAFQAVVYVKATDKDDWERAGVGFKCDLGFVTANHVISEATKVKLENNGKSLEFDAQMFQYQENVGDLAILSAEVPFLKKAKLSKRAMSGEESTMVMVSNGNLASMGALSAMNGFGLVKYMGSTAAGFSGAPYFLGNTVFGLHLGASSVNMGYDSGLLALLAMRPESSEDYYLDKIRRGDRYEFNEQLYDDEVVVKVGGRYMFLSKDAFAQLEYEREMELQEKYDYMSMTYGDQITYDDTGRSGRRRRGGYTYGGPDYLYESLSAPRIDFDDSENFERPAVTVNGSAGQHLALSPNVQSLSTPISTVTNAPFPVPGSRCPTAAPEPTRVQNVEASNTTSISISPEAATRKMQEARNKKLRFRLAAQQRRLASLEARVKNSGVETQLPSTSSAGQ